jgi:uncharacterized protein (TIGR00730 family)
MRGMKCAHFMPSRRSSQGRDFTGGALPYFYQRRGSTGQEAFDQRIHDLVKDWGAEHNPELVEELIITALKLAKEPFTTGDMKLFNRTLREFREAGTMFAPFQAQRKVVVFGSARTPYGQPETDAADEFSRKAVEKGFMVITGGGEGIMGAAQHGAGRDSSFGLNIKLPFEQDANDTIDGDRKLVTFNYFFTRKLNFVKEAEAFALFAGGFGTMDELFEVLTLIQTGKAAVLPIVMVEVAGGTYWRHFDLFVRDQLLRRGLISVEDLSLFKIVENADQALAEIMRFYRVFHSYRYVGKQLVFRLTKELSETKVADINTDFRDLLAEGDYTQGTALPAEANETELAALPRLIFTPKRRNFGRLRQLIDAVNS